ncbi:hypothetical protein NG831_06505 [Xanthomonas sacchari]|uniref:hypothetical protein n=1 Tax=Xanthomonas sacchari TaxID=56458 RepID=UPI00224D12D2|nr:hypothetical protein [Xanthomonas sacchari]MCW0413488.1 hypothetical protein [Xanthomonas sacchari]UYK67811.1 hypothetical protein NG831_06505 [Xanthomonas sacchari]
MDPTDPNITPDPQQQDAATPGADDGTNEVAQNPPEVANESAADAFSQGVEEARKAEADGRLDPDGAPMLPNGQTAEANKPDPAAVDAAKPDAAAPPANEAKAQPEAAPPADVEAEIKDLGIKNERAAQRFRELSERAAEVEPLRAQAARASEWEQTVTSTGATPEQFGSALNYLRAINSGNPQAMNNAYDVMQKELQWLGEKLGREAPGFDPLSVHADLAEKVKAGDITREAASEIVQHRQRLQLQQQHDTSQQQSWQAQQAEQMGLQQVAALGNQLRTADPDFQRKFQFLAPTVALIQQTLPPQQWAAQIQAAYQQLPALPPAQAPAARPSSPSPIRPSGTPALAAKPKNAAEAFDFGVQEARARGM